MASRNLNKVMLIGNLTRDPELRYTAQGTAVCTFGLATNRSWMTDSGERREDVEFHRIVAWNKLAELCSQLLSKGRKVFVEGRLQTRTWTGQDSAQRTTTEIVINEMIILDSKKTAIDSGALEKTDSSPTKRAGTSMVTQTTDDDIPQKKATESEKKETEASEKKAKSKEKQVASNKKTDEKIKEDVSPEDIPF